MAGHKIKLNRKELIIISVLVTAFILEILLLMLLIYYEKFEIFISLFIKALKILSPIFLGLNVIIIISTIFIRRKELIVKPWKIYFKEVLRFSIASSAMAFALIVTSALLGVTLELVLRRISHLPAIEAAITSLREWVMRNFY